MDCSVSPTWERLWRIAVSKALRDSGGVLCNENRESEYAANRPFCWCRGQDLNLRLGRSTWGPSTRSLTLLVFSRVLSQASVLEQAELSRATVRLPRRFPRHQEPPAHLR